MLQIQFAQVFWSEAFGSGAKNTSIDGLDTGNGAWTEIENGTQGTKANSWFASKEECGNDATECGSACASDASLHVGSVSVSFICPGGDCGAAYLVASTSKTNKDAISPLISTTGYSGIILNFNYIGYGEGTQDVASWNYSCDGGSTWTFVTNLTTNCCTAAGAATTCGSGCGFFGCQGKWTAYSYSLPSSADNISNFKIKFNWINDNDANGKDPSFAIDDITLSYLVLPIELVTFTAHEITSGVELNWSTQTENNSGHFVIERSFDGEQFIVIGTVDGNETITQQYYKFTDDNNTINGIRYYRLKQIEADGNFAYSKIISIQTEQQHINYLAEQTPDQLIISSTQFKNSELTFELFNTAGNIISKYYFQHETTSFIIDLHLLPVGVYLLTARNNMGENVFVHKFSNY